MHLPDALEVFVEIDGAPVRAGTLGASFGGGRSLAASWFAYDRDYAAAPGAYALDPTLPLGAGRIFSGADQQLFGAFEDLTPDDWGERVIDAALAGARARGEAVPARVGAFDYLALSADESRLGAIRFRAEGRDEWLAPTEIDGFEPDRLPRYAEAAARMEAHEATDEDLRLLGAPGTSAGGARPKVMVRVDGRVQMLKLPSERDRGRDGEAWEWVAIELARRAGVNVQRGRLLTVPSGRSSLLLHRFDRAPNDVRIGYMSARTAMGLGDQGHARVTYEQFADAVDELTEGDRGQLRDLFARVALNVLISNDDDHWKNHGFVRAGHRWALAPAFDLNPAPRRGATDARPISDVDDPRNRDIRNLVAGAGTYALTSDEAARTLDGVLAAVRNWPDVARAARIPEREIELMAGAFPEDQQRYAEEAIRKAGGPAVVVDLGAASGGEERDAQADGGPGEVWIAPHERRGRHVAGFWRRRAQPGSRDD